MSSSSRLSAGLRKKKLSTGSESLELDMEDSVGHLRSSVSSGSGSAGTYSSRSPRLHAANRRRDEFISMEDPESDSRIGSHILDIPIRLTKQIFILLPLEDLTSCMLVCSAWFNVLGDENINVWKYHCSKRVPRQLADTEPLKLCTTYKSKLRAVIHSWNPYDCSANGSVEGVTFIRSQMPQTTDGCRARIGFREGRHVWQVIFMDPLGSCAMVGVATRSTILFKQGYGPLIGGDRHSWGWNLQANLLVHKGDPYSYYPPDPKIKYKVGDILHVLLDCEDRTLSFKKNGHFLGVAFRDLPLPNKELFPAVSAVYGGSRVSMAYLGTIPEVISKRI